MTNVEAIIMSEAARAKIKSSTELARRAGIPVSTMRDKLLHPGKIRLSELCAIDRVAPLSAEGLMKIMRVCSGR